MLEPVLRDSTQRRRTSALPPGCRGVGGYGARSIAFCREPWLIASTDWSLTLARSPQRREDSCLARTSRRGETSNPHGRESRVLIARALDRMDSLDRAASEYTAAAALLPDVADWLRLRAAAVTRDSAARATQYVAVKAGAAKARAPWVDAQARERAGDLVGAALAYDHWGGWVLRVVS